MEQNSTYSNEYEKEPSEDDKPRRESGPIKDLKDLIPNQYKMDIIQENPQQENIDDSEESSKEVKMRKKKQSKVQQSINHSIWRTKTRGLAHYDLELMDLDEIERLQKEIEQKVKKSFSENFPNPLNHLHVKAQGVSVSRDSLAVGKGKSQDQILEKELDGFEEESRKNSEEVDV